MKNSLSSQFHRILQDNIPEELLLPLNAPIPEHEGTLGQIFPNPDLPQEVRTKIIDSMFDLSQDFVIYEIKQGNTSIRVYRDTAFQFVYKHHNPTFGEREVRIDFSDIEAEREETRGFFVAARWSASQNALFVGIYHPDPKFTELRKAVVLTEDKLRLIRDAVEKLEEILKAEGREEEAHQFLKSNGTILGLTSTIDPISKFKLGDDFETDFVIKEIPEGYILIEIERPDIRLFKKVKKGRPPERHRDLNHAIEQVETWKAWISKYHSYISSKLPGISPSPMCWIIAGRSTHLSKEEENRLTEINQEYRSSYKIFTYDDLLARVRAVIGKF